MVKEHIKNYATIAEWGDDLKGRPIRVIIEQETYNGKTNAKVKFQNETKHKPFWQREGLEMPNCVKEAVKDYRSKMDVIGAFLDDCCTIGPGSETTASCSRHTSSGLRRTTSTK